MARLGNCIVFLLFVFSQDNCLIVCIDISLEWLSYCMNGKEIWSTACVDHSITLTSNSVRRPRAMTFQK